MRATAGLIQNSPISACLPAVGDPKPIGRHRGLRITRLAVMGGSYGNLPALQACLQHAREAGCDGYAFLGDATGFCGHSDETIEIVRRHFPILVAGNYEQKAGAHETDCGCNYTNGEDNHWGSIAHQWAMGSLNEINRAWLGTWPDLVLLETVRGGVLLCHGSPAQTNEFLYESELDEDRLGCWLDVHGAIGFVCTHSGFPWARQLAGSGFAVNCGACGKPDHDADPAVHYVTLDLRANPSPTLRIERVEYDHDAWADQLTAEGVSEVFTSALRTGVWNCGLLSLPPAERGQLEAVSPRALCAPVMG